MDAFPIDEGFDPFLKRIGDGDPDAARELVEAYGSLVKKAVRIWLDTRVRTLYDSDDLTQEVWSTFFADPTSYDLDDPEQLLAALHLVARNMTVKVNRRHLQCQKRDVRRGTPLEEPEAASLTSREPSAHDVLVADERMEQIQQGRSYQEQLILTMKRQGWKHREIAEWVGCSEKAIQRLLRDAASTLEPRAAVLP